MQIERTKTKDKFVAQVWEITELEWGSMTSLCKTNYMEPSGLVVLG